MPLGFFYWRNMAVDELKNISKGIKELVTTTKAEFDKLAGKIGSEISGVMSDEMTMVTGHIKSGFDSFKAGASKLLGILGGGWEDGKRLALGGFKLQKKETDTSVKQLKLDTHMAKYTLGYQKDDSKKNKEQLGLMKKMSRWQKVIAFWAKWQGIKSRMSWKRVAKGGIAALFALLAIPLFALGAIIGTQVALLVKPFVIIGKFIANMFIDAKKLTRYGRLFKIMIGGHGPLSGFFKGLRKLVTFFTKIPLIGPMLKGLKFGFTKLFWPLQIILSTIDFIKGFMDTEGTIYEKIKGGIENVIIKFLEFPAKLLGGMWEWFQVNFLDKDPASIEQGAAAKSIIEGIGKTVKMIFKGWELIFGAIWDVTKWLWNDVIAKIDWKALRDKMFEWGARIWNISSSLKEWILGLFGMEGTRVRKASDVENSIVRGSQAGDVNRATLEGLRTQEAKLKDQGKDVEADRMNMRRQLLEAQITGNKQRAAMLEALLNPKEKLIAVPMAAGDSHLSFIPDTTGLQVEQSGW